MKKEELEKYKLLIAYNTLNLLIGEENFKSLKPEMFKEYQKLKKEIEKKH